MNKLIKYDYWIFYIDSNIINDIPAIINPDTLIYAYTDSEEMYNKFMETHNMECFVVIKTRLTKEEIHYLSMTERDKYIVERDILTRGKHGNKTYIKICITIEENKVCKASTSSKLMEYIFKYAKINYPRKIFKKNIRKILEMIGFFDTADMSEGNIPMTADSEKLLIKANDSVINLYVDELVVLSSVFSRVLKVGG